MSKAIKWQIPFASLSGTLYRLDIYAEGYSGDPIQLTAGETPFVTDEDSSEDFFAPIRTQTGSIQVCTRKPDGTMLTLDEILPANNIDHPVRLINLSNSNAIEWQGFLSCEAYSQNYTAIPENLTLSIISVLEAMDSVQLQLSESMAYKKIFAHALYAMKMIEDKSGMSLFGNIYISEYLRQSLQSFLMYNYPYFESEEITNGDNIVAEVHSISCKKVLEEIGQFFGASWREYGQNIYLQVVGQDQTFKYRSFTDYYTYYVSGSGSQPENYSINISTDDMANFDWRGTNHKRDLRQGAMRIKLNASLKDFECNIGLRECPYGMLQVNPQERWSKYGEIYANMNETFYNLATHKHISSQITVYPMGSGMNPHLDFQSFLSAIGYDNTIFWTNNDFRTNYNTYVVEHSNTQTVTIPYTLTSYMALFRNSDDELQSGLIICGVPELLYNNPDDGGAYTTWTRFALTQNNAVYSQSSPLIFSAKEGYIRINFKTAFWRSVSCDYNEFFNINATGYITIALQWGTKWLQYSGGVYSWSNSFTTVKIGINKDGKTITNWAEALDTAEADGIFVRIPELTVGFMKLYIYHEIDVELGVMHYVGPGFDVCISKIEIAYSPFNYELRTHRSSNEYYDETGQPFRDEISKSLAIASNAHNSNQATMVYDSSNKATNAVVLGGSVIRPERDLLNRMVDYYSASRQTLDLIVKHPTAAALPLLKLNGISDGKQYLPLSESRDWRTEECTLTCFETPE